MHSDLEGSNRRILVVDDNPASGLIVPLGQWVLRAVCAQVMRWEQEGIPVVPVAVKLRRQGCETAQGFYFCRPSPAEQCRKLLLDLSQRSSFTETLRMRSLAVRVAHGSCNWCTRRVSDPRARAVRLS